ncbi:HIT family protein [Paenibacillaceae bacterium]|nr:HIT family protein [Paenibacillaceae bacterium]
MNCLGCRIANQLEAGVHVIYENELIVCVLDIAPFNEGHLLILPKQHYLDVEEIDEATQGAIMRASTAMSRLLKQTVKPDGITICQNGGIFNDLGHYHMHLIPRYTGDGFSWSEPKDEFRTSRTLREVQSMLLAGFQGGI